MKLNFKNSLSYFSRLKGLAFAKFANNYPKNINKKKIAVYTTLYGQYDNIKPILVKNNSIDYYAFTDQFVPEKTGWVKCDYDFPKEIQNDNVLKSRFLRMHPHLLFSDYDYSIYIDASFVIKHDIIYLLGRIGENDIGMYRHPWAKDIYDEAKLVIHWKRAPENITSLQVERYKTEGYPKRFGMTTTGVIVCKCNKYTVKQLMEEWWYEFKKPENTKRDQMCLYYVVWKKGLKKDYIKYLGTRVYDDPIIEQNSWYQY